MLAKRIIPCLDVKNGKTVKGVNFINFTDAGDPVQLGKQYSDAGADELVFLDITASHEERATFIDIVKKIALNLNIPFTVGGGISSVDHVAALLDAGADKISINSSALKNPALITDISSRFGSQVCVVAIDAKFIGKNWTCFINGGRKPTDYKLFEWAKEAQDRGAGEILFTSMDHDGVKGGYAIDALRKLHNTLSIPIIASGGAGCIQDFVDVFKEAEIDAALAASLFHFGEISIPELKLELHKNGIPIRISHK